MQDIMLSLNSVMSRKNEPCFQVKDFYDLPDGVDHPKPSQVGLVHHFQGLGFRV